MSAPSSLANFLTLGLADDMPPLLIFFTAGAISFVIFFVIFFSRVFSLISVTFSASSFLVAASNIKISPFEKLYHQL